MTPHNLAIDLSATDGLTEPYPMNQRYAVYFAPADNSSLGLFGASVLRRTAQSADLWINPDIPYLFDNTEVWQACVKKPAHYGFHATIKAPFELQAGQSLESLLVDVQDFCQTQSAMSLATLAPRKTRRFDALAFEQQPEEIKAFAARCVERFEPYRAPLTPEDLERRHKDQLSSQQIQHLNQYGYPYVLDQFNFHMTLSGVMPNDDNGYLRWLRTIYPLMVPEVPVLDRLSVFHQPDRQSPFLRIAEFPFTG